VKLIQTPFKWVGLLIASNNSSGSLVWSTSYLLRPTSATFLCVGPSVTGMITITCDNSRNYWVGSQFERSTLWGFDVV